MAIFSRIIALFMLSFYLSLTVNAEKRVALVIGNSKYTIGPLKNPANEGRRGKG
jgi:hypothetical protein